MLMFHPILFLFSFLLNIVLKILPSHLVTLLECFSMLFYKLLFSFHPLLILDHQICLFSYQQFFQSNQFRYLLCFCDHKEVRQKWIVLGSIFNHEMEFIRYILYACHFSLPHKHQKWNVILLWVQHLRIHLSIKVRFLEK